ncbi:MAG TPA: FtsQ-type POTRA domain-containing protein [Candidatus Acidoferrales bacterium]|nr:FtsQ-type POTRA domain-containing protein [Candidatus Acidoferrales bacterium]
MKRRRATAAQRLRPFWLLIALVALLCLAGGYFLATWPALRPHRVEVVGNRVVSESAILQSAQIDYGENMWLQNAHGMAARIEAIPYIDSASIRRMLPSTLVITVTERAPYALIVDGGSLVTVDHTLRVLQQGVPLGMEDALPAFSVGLSDAPPLVGILDALLAADLKPRTIGFDRFGDVTVTLRSGIRVLLGDRSGSVQKVEYIKPILDKVDRGPRKVAAIDLRALTTPVVVYAK